MVVQAQRIQRTEQRFSHLNNIIGRTILTYEVCVVVNSVNEYVLCTFAIIGRRYTSGESIFRPRIVPPIILSLFGLTMSSRAIGSPWFIMLCGFDPPLSELDVGPGFDTLTLLEMES